MKKRNESVHLRIDEKLQREFGLMCNELGMTPNAAIYIFIKKVSVEKRIPFDVAIHDSWSISNSNQFGSNKEYTPSGQIVVGGLSKELKIDFMTVCEELGMNVTTAITIFIKRFIHKRGIPFNLSVKNSTCEEDEI